MPTTLYEAVVDWLEYSVNKLNKKGIILKVKDKSGKEYFTSVDREDYEGLKHALAQNFSRMKSLVEEKDVLETYEVHLVVKKDPNGLYITPIPIKIVNR
jgi:hypothetical protein